MSLGRWSREPVIKLLDRYEDQQRPYWYNVIAAMGGHLYGYAAMNPQAPEGCA